MQGGYAIAAATSVQLSEDARDLAQVLRRVGLERAGCVVLFNLWLPGGAHCAQVDCVDAVEVADVNEQTVLGLSPGGGVRVV